MQTQTINRQVFPHSFLENNSFIVYRNETKRIILNREEIDIISLEESKSYPQDKILNDIHLNHLINNPKLIPAKFTIDFKRYFNDEERMKIIFPGSLFHFNGYQGESIVIPSMAYWKSMEIDQDTDEIFEGHVFAGTTEEKTYVAVFK
jgi:hypothetical protein